MIKYDKLWETMKAKGISQYDLYTHYHMNRSQLNRLRHDQNVEVNTIDKLCNILDCNVVFCESFLFETVTKCKMGTPVTVAIIPQIRLFVNL